MKKRTRDINIFSMSALDLFASALGAFILVTIVLFPYFPNLADSSDSIETLKAEQALAGAELQRALAGLEMENARLKAESDKAGQENARLQAENTRLGKERARSSQRERGQLEERVRRLQREVDNTTVLLGIRTTAKKFAIVVDMSGSIYQRGGHDYRSFITLSVRDVLSSFKSDIDVVLIGFHAPNERTKLYYWPENRRYFRVRKHTRNSVISAIDDWMNRVDGFTPTREALIAALALDPEEIILMSDGAPTEDWRQVVQSVTARNTRKMPIHAVAVGNYVTKRDFIDFLVQLTERNRGYLVGAKPG